MPSSVDTSPDDMPREDIPALSGGCRPNVTITSRRGSEQAVTEPSHRLHEPRRARFPKLAAKVRDVLVDEARFDPVRVDPPHLEQEVVARVDPPRMLRER